MGKAKAREAALYQCDCCRNRILANSGDPVHMVGKRVLCTRCLSSHSAEQAARQSAEAKTREAARSRGSRSAAGKARWAAMTEEQRAATVARLRNRKVAAVPAGDGSVLVPAATSEVES